MASRRIGLEPEGNKGEESKLQSEGRRQCPVHSVYAVLTVLRCMCTANRISLAHHSPSQDRTCLIDPYQRPPSAATREGYPWHISRPIDFVRYCFFAEGTCRCLEDYILAGTMSCRRVHTLIVKRSKRKEMTHMGNRRVPEKLASLHHLEHRLFSCLPQYASIPARKATRGRR